MIAKGKKGFQYGNTLGRGRPLGSPNRASHIRKYASDEDHEIVMRNLIDLAKGGDFQAISLYVNKVCQIPKLPSTVDLDFAKKIHSMSDMNEAMTELAYGAMTGAIHLDDAKELMALVESKGHSIQKCNAEELDSIRQKLYEIQNKRN